MSSIRQLDDPVYKIVDVSTSAPDVLCRLFKEVFGSEMTPSIWSWKYRSDSLLGNVNVALYRDNELVGHAGAIIFSAYFNGQKIECAQICDVMLHPSERGSLSKEDGYPYFMNALINALKSSLPNGLYFGFPGVRPFKLGQRLGLYRGTGVIKSYRMRTVKSYSFQYYIRPISWDSAAIAAVCRRRTLLDSNRLFRNPDYLKWRYKSNPTTDYVILGLYLGLILVEWIVIKKSNDGLVLVDCSFSDEKYGKYLKILSNWANANGYNYFDYWAEGLIIPTQSCEVTVIDTQMVGVVMCSSSTKFDYAVPSWVPGDTDVF